MTELLATLPFCGLLIVIAAVMALARRVSVKLERRGEIRKDDVQ